MANDRLCVVQNLKTGAITQLVGFNFNSFARIGNYILAANEEGLYQLGGDTFAGSAINSYYEFVHDFGQTVRMRSIWISFYTADNIKITLTIDDRTADAQSYTITPNLTSKEHAMRVFLKAHVDKGQIVKIKIENVNGADFSIDRIMMTVIPKGHHREG